MDTCHAPETIQHVEHNAKERPCNQNPLELHFVLCTRQTSMEHPTHTHTWREKSTITLFIIVAERDEQDVFYYNK